MTDYLRIKGVTAENVMAIGPNEVTMVCIDTTVRWKTHRESECELRKQHLEERDLSGDAYPSVRTTNEVYLGAGCTRAVTSKYEDIQSALIHLHRRTA